MKPTDSEIHALRLIAAWDRNRVLGLTRTMLERLVCYGYVRRDAWGYAELTDQGKAALKP